MLQEHNSFSISLSSSPDDGELGTKSERDQRRGPEKTPATRFRFLWISEEPPGPTKARAKHTVQSTSSATSSLPCSLPACLSVHLSQASLGAAGAGSRSCTFLHLSIQTDYLIQGSVAGASTQRRTALRLAVCNEQTVKQSAPVTSHCLLQIAPAI